jgi:hypothetical protein
MVVLIINGDVDNGDVDNGDAFNYCNQEGW